MVIIDRKLTKVFDYLIKNAEQNWTSIIKLEGVVRQGCDFLNSHAHFSINFVMHINLFQILMRCRNPINSTNFFNNPNKPTVFQFSKIRIWSLSNFLFRKSFVPIFDVNCSLFFVFSQEYLMSNY